MNYHAHYFWMTDEERVIVENILWYNMTKKNNNSNSKVELAKEL